MKKKGNNGCLRKTDEGNCSSDCESNVEKCQNNKRETIKTEVEAEQSKIEVWYVSHVFIHR